ncbi:MAG: dethiobiotin synthase [Actinobacteria bacterium]|nr:MAG: dethiobiotin synthase [Actinomycetota bacterium]
MREPAVRAGVSGDTLRPLREPSVRETRETARRGLFVTGTDTGVGKTVLAAAIAAALRARGERVAAAKPVLTGTDEPPDTWPHDDELLASATSQAPTEVAPVRFGPPVSPHLAAELAGTRLSVAELAARTLATGDGDATLVVEGIGGLLVPLGAGASVRDLARALGLGVVVAARTGLGTINHTLLTLEAARAGGLDVRAVVLGPWPRGPSALERSNAATIAELGRVAVATLGEVASPDPDALAAAARDLPLDDWLGAGRTAAPPLDHLVIAVSDWERSNAFYREVVGVEVRRAPGDPPRFRYRLAGVQLNVHGPGMDPQPVARIPAAPGMADLCFAWPGPIEGAAAHLRRHGVAVEEGPVPRYGARGPAQSVYFRDPDGSLLEFMSYAAGGEPAP